MVSSIFMFLKRIIEGVDYSDGFQYKDGVLQFFPTAEGYVNHYEAIYNYVYHYKDHLGNVRVSYAKDPVSGLPKIVEESNYCPFGMKHANYNSDQLAFQPNAQDAIVLDAFVEPLPLDNYINYNYNGKQFQDEMGLGLYAMDARQYDPAIGRFTSIDPVVHYKQSPYVVLYNNPVYWADPSGMNGEHYNWDKGRELEGLELAPYVNIALGNNPPLVSATEVVKLGTEVGGKATEVAGKTESHHLIPRALKNHDRIKAARDEGFKFEGQENRVPLEKYNKETGKEQHGNHPKYNTGIEEKLDAGPSESNVTAVDFVRTLVSETKELILKNPDIKVNDLFLNTTVIENTSVRKPDLPKQIVKEKKKIDLTNAELY